jgi:hypothetical protein
MNSESGAVDAAGWLNKGFFWRGASKAALRHTERLFGPIGRKSPALTDAFLTLGPPAQGCMHASSRKARLLSLARMHNLLPYSVKSVGDVCPGPGKRG